MKKQLFIAASLRILTGLVMVASAANLNASSILTGAGATFPYPIYSKWFDTYAQMKNIRINYQSIGSGGGIRQMSAQTVDFGATDAPMNKQQLSRVDRKIYHIPTVLGGVTPTFNVRGVQELNLTGSVIAEIFLGKIQVWNDKRIVELNPDAQLPNARIITVHRSDGSGTTFAWTDYLTKVSPEWNQRVGRGIAVNWPGGLGGKGNEGVSGLIRQTPNSIGYVELVYALQNKLNTAAVQNKEGEFVKATVESVAAAAASMANEMTADFRVSITNAPGKGVFPISTYTWLLVYENNKDGKGKVIKDFLLWALNDGKEMAVNLGYAVLPDDVHQMVLQTIEKIN
jgi:phosphate transport system substrate-binding protein